MNEATVKMETPPSTFVTIVSGLPRSGTSMMMRMLESGGMDVLTDEVRTADDDNPNGYYEFEPVKTTRDDPGWLTSAPGKVVKLVYRLLYDLPAEYQYRVIFMRRHLDEVLASQKKMLVRNGKDAEGVSDEQMAALFRGQLKKFDTWIAKQRNFTTLDVNYNDMLSEPTLHVDQLIEFLGDELDAASMASTINPKLYRNRR